MDQEKYSEVHRLSQYRDLLQHPGYRALLNDLTDARESVIARLLAEPADDRCLLLLREVQVFNKIYQVLSRYPEECATRLVGILGEAPEEKGIQ